MPRSRRLVGTPETSVPPMRTTPPCACSSPASTRSAVVFPQPDGPSSDTNSPGSIARSRPCSTGAACATAPGPSDDEQQCEREDECEQREHDRRVRVLLADDHERGLQVLP